MKRKIEKNNGITLIALVITIIILLILAGISINMISGQDGILNKATEAKNKSQQAQTEDELKLLSSEYQLKKYSDGENIENYLNENLKDATIIKANYSDSAQVEHNGKKYVVADTGEVTEINEENNLVKNGFLTYKDNTNFLDWTYDDMGFLTKTVTEDTRIWRSALIEIDTSKKYFQSITIRANDENAKYYVGLHEYDIDKKNIGSSHISYVKDTLTYLEKDINDGDTVIYLNDVSEFDVEPSIYLKDVRNGLIFWNYKDSTGYEYPELTYSRNVYTELFDYDQIDKENNTITLKNPWNKGTITAGTKLSQSTAGSYANFGILKLESVTNDWTTKCNVITNIIENGNIEQFQKFRVGTKYVQIHFVLNYGSKSSSVKTDIKDIVFQEIK